MRWGTGPRRCGQPSTTNFLDAWGWLGLAQSPMFGLYPATAQSTDAGGRSRQHSCSPFKASRDRLPDSLGAEMYSAAGPDLNFAPFARTVSISEQLLNTCQPNQVLNLILLSFCGTNCSWLTHRTSLGGVSQMDLCVHASVPWREAGGRRKKAGAVVATAATAARNSRGERKVSVHVCGVT